MQMVECASVIVLYSEAEESTTHAINAHVGRKVVVAISIRSEDAGRTIKVIAC